MNKKFSIVNSAYKPLIINHPISVLVVMILAISYLGYRAKDFKLDASADSLTLENDKNLLFYREISQRYSNSNFLLMTLTPKHETLFSSGCLDQLKTLRNELRALERVENVVTILDVPLLRNPPVPINKLLDNIKSLEDPNADLELAQEEFAYSPIYQNLLISADLKTTALKIDFARDLKFDELASKRNELRQEKAAGTLTATGHNELQDVIQDYELYKTKLDADRHNDIIKVREIMANYKENADLYLGGVPMIADDMITFIKNDLQIFGVGMLILITLILGFIFRQIRWVAISILCCFCSTLSMIGLIGMFNWKVTVISSNFVSLQLIITMSLVIHLIVRYNELFRENPGWSQKELILETVCSKLQPCLFATLTTIAGFSSLLICEILPVINFGMMMMIGLIVSLIVTFTVFPSILMLLPKMTNVSHYHFGKSFISVLADSTKNYGLRIYTGTAILAMLIIFGITRLSVENSFIDFFKKSTDIYKGMKIIDQTMGGTTPLDVLINFKDDSEISAPTASDADEFDEFDEFEEFDEAEDDDRYWYTSDKIALLSNIHDYLDNLPETGKILSLETMVKIAESFNNDNPLSNFQLALLYSEIPERYRAMILAPYVSIENNQARLSIRIKDSEESLRRNAFLRKIEHEIQDKFNLDDDQVQLSGMMKLYNNMLQSLFRSQILTLVFVLIILTLMFSILFRSFKLAIIAIIPNLLSSLSVLGVMGLAGISLDMMTITIVAISIGIAVDNAIHYIHRFRKEIVSDYSYIDAMKRSHNSVGNAMMYTSLTIVIGFSILVFSNFIPSILFGLLTGLAMIIALFGALTLLPLLIVTIKPFGTQP